MYTGKFNAKHTGKFAAKRRFSRRSILLTVSMLVLCMAMVGGTVAWLAASTDPVENVFAIPGPGIDIDEKFDNIVKSDVGVKNTGDIPLYVRMQLVYSYKDADGNVYPAVPVAGKSYTLVPGSSDWVLASDGTYYYTKPLPVNASTPAAIQSITPKFEGLSEDITLDVQVLAQYVQAEGFKDGKPIVEAMDWPVTVQPDGSLALK